VDGLSRLPSLLAKYEYPRVFLLQFGTNDAVATPPIPSGLGLHSGDAGYSGSFKDNMQQMINQLASAGKTAYLAKAPYSTDALSAQRNSYVQQYNNVVDELTLENNIAVVPPDFYCFFKNNQNQIAAGGIHPNGVGYQSMAAIWRDTLMGLYGGCH
jgi:lysophospholipase L1-like esterase